MEDKYIPEEIKNKIKELKESGKTVYSISRLDTYNNCQYAYYLNYILKEKGIDNVYNLLGSAVHDSFQAIYQDGKDKSVMLEAINQSLDDCDLLDVTFPNDMIGDSWKRDMLQFANNFNKVDYNVKCEVHFLVELLPDIWLQGFIDAVDDTDKDNVIILDWKTSTKFKTKDLQKYGRQLIVYLLSEQHKGNTVKKIGWYMTKYLITEWNQILKSGKTSAKSRLCKRGKWVEEMSNNIEKDLKALGYDSFDIELDLDSAKNNNNLQKLPKEISEKYLTKDCIIEYNIDKETIQETKDYIENTVDEIELKAELGLESEWLPKDIKKDEFFCNVLCNHRRDCKYLKQHNIDKETENDIDDDLDGIL